MRLLVLVLAIVLLPLRGWVGDAMMLAPAPVAQAAASHAMHAMADGAMDAHAMHDEGTAHGSTHTTCDTCQFCHSVAVTAWPDVPMPAAAPAHAPAAEALRFVSAEAIQGFKPPIS